MFRLKIKLWFQQGLLAILVGFTAASQAATDQAGTVIWREKYKPYGERTNNENAASSNSRWFTGHPQDAESGLVYAGARYYDPTLGRFMATDPVSFTEKNLHSFNRYAYGNNNPYKYVDPDGREVIFNQ